jgi:uncharacterized protein YkwD
MILKTKLNFGFAEPEVCHWNKSCRSLHKFKPVLKTNFFRLGFIFSIACLFSFTIDNPQHNGLAEDVFKHTNQFRRARGLQPLEMRSDLNDIARKHSEDMASGRKSFGHGGYDLRVLKVKKIVKECDGSVAENVAYGANSGKEAFDIWKNSTPHRKNMLGNYKYIGIGTARNRNGVIYYTQIFVR